MAIAAFSKSLFDVEITIIDLCSINKGKNTWSVRDFSDRIYISGKNFQSFDINLRLDHFSKLFCLSLTKHFKSKMTCMKLWNIKEAISSSYF